MDMIPKSEVMKQIAGFGCLTLEALRRRRGEGGQIGFKFLLLDRLSKALVQLFLVC